MTAKNMHTVSEKDAWGDQTHADVFDYLAAMPTYMVRRHYESFNEGRLLNEYAGGIRGDAFFEIGCATGELYRYISRFMSRFQYTGFDISAPAIERARAKFPGGRFHLLTSGFDEIRSLYGQPDVLWCRDVVMHQEDPYAFLRGLIDLGGEAVVLRLRTRDVGETVLDVERSCQLHWDRFWVPYIVLNTDEMVRKIKESADVASIVVSRNYEVLGGQNYRYLPKELYFTDTGTAETAVFIRKGPRAGESVNVSFRDRPDRPRYGIVDRLIRKGYASLKGKR